MYLTFAATGTLAAVIQSVEQQLAQGGAGQANADAVARGALYVVQQELGGVPADATVSVNGMLQIQVTKPTAHAHK